MIKRNDFICQLNFFILISIVILLSNEYSKNKCDDESRINSKYFHVVTEYNKTLGKSVERQLIMYNRHIPLIFVGGVPRSGTTLMRAMLDSHPKIRCGEETRLVPNIIAMRQSFRLPNAPPVNVANDVLDSAVASSVLEMVLRHGPFVENLCNKDPLVLGHAIFVKQILPNSKFILMVRDARATVHSVFSRKVSQSSQGAIHYCRFTRMRINSSVLNKKG